MSDVNKRIIYSIELSALILVGLLFLTYYNIKRLDSREKWVAHTHEVLAHAVNIQFMTAKCETQAEYYMLTRNKDFADRFTTTSTTALRELDTVKSLTSDNAAIQPTLDSAALYIAKRIAFCSQIIQLTREKGQQYAVWHIQTGRGKDYQDKCSFYIEYIKHNERRLMAIRISDSKQALTIMNISFLVTSVFIIAMIASQFRKSKKETADRNQIVDELIRSTERMREAEKLASFGTWSIDPRSRVMTASDEMYRIWGYDPNEKGNSDPSFTKKIHPDDWKFVKFKVSDLDKQKGTDSYTFRLIDNGQTKYISHGVTVVHDRDGKLLSVTGYVHDITEKKLAALERERIVADLIQRNKTLEQFTYIVSHNLRVPVANIVGLGTVFESMDDDPDEQKVVIRKMVSSVKGLDDMVKDLNSILQVRDHTEDEKEIVNFDHVVIEVIKSLHPTTGLAKVQIECDFSQADQLLTIRDFLYSIFYNLFLNSIRYGQGNVATVINVKSIKTDQYVELIFSDNGKGIDLEKNAATLFGLYRRYDTTVEGKGMGLFMVKTQVEALGGTIEVKSELDKGTEFSIRLPVS